MNSILVDDLVMARAEFAVLGDWTPAGLAFIESLGVSFAEIISHAGRMAPSHCIIENGQFVFDQGGEQCVIFEVLAADDETVIDLCAFAVADLTRFGTAVGGAVILGAAKIYNPASWSWGRALPVLRNPLTWLKHAGKGIVILDYRFAPAALRNLPGRILAEDEPHAQELRLMLSTPPVPPAMIVYPGFKQGKTA